MNRRSFLGTAAASGLFLSGAVRRGFAARGDLASGPAVSTTSGKIKGLFDGRVHSFKGIPYGTSPADNRFLPPLRPTTWTGVREFTEIGPRSFQPVRIMVPEMGTPSPVMAR